MKKQKIEKKSNEKKNFGKYTNTEYFIYDVENDLYNKKEQEIEHDVNQVRPDESNENFLDHFIDMNTQVIKRKLNEKHILNKYAASQKPLEVLADAEVAKMKLEVKKKEITELDREVELDRKLCEEKIANFTDSLTKIKRGFFSTSLGLCLLTVLAMAVDSISIFDVLKMTLLQAPVLTYALCAAVVAVLDFLPTTIVSKIKDISRREKRCESCIILVLSIFAFIVMYATVVNLRIANIDSYSQTGVEILYDEASTDEITETVTEDEENVNDSVATAIVWMMNLIPLCTSILLFGFSMDKYNKDEEASILNNFLYSKSKQTAVNEEIQKLTGEIMILENDQYDYVGLQEELYKANLGITDEQSREMKSLVRLKIMERLHKAEDTSFLASKEANAYAD